MEPRRNRQRGAPVSEGPRVAGGRIPEHHRRADAPPRPTTGQRSRSSGRGAPPEQEGSRGHPSPAGSEARCAFGDSEGRGAGRRSDGNAVLGGSLNWFGCSSDGDQGTARGCSAAFTGDRWPHFSWIVGAVAASRGRAAVAGPVSTSVHGVEGHVRQASTGAEPAVPRGSVRRSGRDLRACAGSARALRREEEARRDRHATPAPRADPGVAVHLRSRPPRSEETRRQAAVRSLARPVDARSGGSWNGITSTRMDTRARQRSRTSRCAAEPTTSTRARSPSGRGSPVSRPEPMLFPGKMASFRNDASRGDRSTPARVCAEQGRAPATPKAVAQLLRGLHSRGNAERDGDSGWRGSPEGRRGVDLHGPPP